MTPGAEEGDAAKGGTAEGDGMEGDELEVALVGAHMDGLPLNGEITALGGRLDRAAVTAPCYRLYALPGGPPHRPGLLRVAEGEGAAIALEVWRIPSMRIGALLAAIPSPLGLGTLRLADGTAPHGFLVEAEGVRGARDITGFGGWRTFLARADGATGPAPLAGPDPERPAMPDAPTIQAEVVAAAAALSGVPLRPEWRDAVRANFATIAAASTFVRAFPLDDEAEPAPAFRP